MSRDGPPLDDALRGLGVRIAWSDLPEAVRRGIEQMLGGVVANADSQPGGFSPGVAARVQLVDGRRVFVKVVGETLDAHAPVLFRREAQVAAALPDGVPTPLFIDAYDDGGWVALVFEDVESRTPRLPWRTDELDRVLAALSELGRSLTPSPIELARISENASGFSGFRELSRELASGSTLADLDPWIQRHVHRLAALHDGWQEATEGDTLLHLDLRADNVLLTEERVLFVDWPHATVGAAWIDLVFLLPSVAMQGGPAPWSIFDGHPVAQDLDDEAVTIALAGLAGMFTAFGRRPDPPGLPTLRRFQRAQAAEAVRWLQRRTGWS